MIYTHVLNRGGKGAFSLADRFNMTAINMLVACEDGSSFFEKGRVKKEFIGKDLVTAAVLHRGLISGQEIDKAVLVGGYCSCFLLFLDWGFPGTPPEEPAVHLIVRRAQYHGGG